MIDRGISEEYLVLWLDESDSALQARIEQVMKSACIVTRYGAGGMSLNEIYSCQRNRLGLVLAAEYLRRVLHELADPTLIDDSLPAPDSPIWEYVYRSQDFLPYRAF